MRASERAVVSATERAVGKKENEKLTAEGRQLAVVNVNRRCVCVGVCVRATARVNKAELQLGSSSNSSAAATATLVVSETLRRADVRAISLSNFDSASTEIHK